MLTLRELLKFNIPTKDKDHTSGPLLKLLLVTIWANQGRTITYAELAQIVGSGDRTVFRGARKLRDLGIVDVTERINPAKGGGVRWSLYEHILRRMLDAQEHKERKERGIEDRPTTVCA
jgi:predicted transcriptional regulator